jgi:nucleoside-diphosphate-sugar epimerase
MRALVTGATGKIGNAVVRRLIERGDDVLALVRDPAKARGLLPDGVELARGDVADPASVRGAAEGIDGAFNCMGLFEQSFADPGVFDRINAVGARNVVAAAREAGAKRVVHTSTFDVFHAPEGGTVTEREVADYPKGTAYERSKQLAERLVLEEAAGGIDVVIANPASVYGPGPWQGTGLDRAIRDAIRRRLPATPPGGMTLAFVDDVAAGHLAAFDRGRPGERYILADGYAPMRELLSLAVAEAGRGRVPPRLPVGMAKGMARAGEAVARLIRRPPLLGSGQLTFLLWEARASNEKARTELGIEFTPLAEGVARTVRWMAETGRL